MDDMMIHRRRCLCRDLLEYASDHDRDRSTGDPVYRQIVEGMIRQSSCAFVGHWMLFHAGVRLPFINRDEHEGWKPGVNVSRLCYTGNKLAKPYTGQPLDAGDVIAIWDHPRLPDGRTKYDEHIVCVSADCGDGVFSTVEGGQPGIKAFNCQIDSSRRLKRVGGKPGRKVQSVLLLADVLRAAESAGKLVPWGEIERSHGS